MNLLATDTGLTSIQSRLTWDHSPPAMISGAEAWSRALLRLLSELRDEQGHRFPLRSDLWVKVYPPRGGCGWRAEADAIGPTIVGRGKSADDALHDWRVRFRSMVQRALEIRPFESTAEDRALRERIETVIDVAHYKASKPVAIRQVGKVVKKRTGLTVVQWEDGAREKVKADAFDEAFARYQIGQSFEAIVTRHPISFRLLRASAVRRLSSQPASKERSDAIWERAIASPEPAGLATPAIELDERFWLTPPE